MPTFVQLIAHPALACAVLLAASNLFMTFAWYGHSSICKRPRFGWPCWEVITLSVFVPFAVMYMGEPLKLEYLWAALCLFGAVYFIFRG